MPQITEINLRDENLGLEFTLECDLENGKIYAWHVNCIEPMPLQNAINVPFLVRQPSAGPAPCAQKQAAAMAQQRHGPPSAPMMPPDAVYQQARVVKRVKLHPETGEPMITE